MLTPRLICADIRLVARGIADWWRYLRSPFDVEVGLGLFSAETGTVSVDGPNRYQARLASVSPRPVTATLALDVHDAETAMPYASFVWSVLVPPNTTQVATIEYDGLAEACLIVGDVRWSTARAGTATILPRVCALTASLCRPDGAMLDRLTIYQERAR
jgi:hypothetical protein